MELYLSCMVLMAAALSLDRSVKSMASVKWVTPSSHRKKLSGVFSKWGDEMNRINLRP